MFKILSSITLNNILSSSVPQIFVFLIFTFVKICQNEVLSEENQLMKWVGILRVGIFFWMGIFRREIFQGGVWWVGIFRVGISPGVIFLESINI